VWKSLLKLHHTTAAWLFGHKTRWERGQNPKNRATPSSVILTTSKKFVTPRATNKTVAELTPLHGRKLKQSLGQSA
jgi:hypothetical protein